MVLQLFELVNEKNELFRKHAELMYLYVPSIYIVYLYFIIIMPKPIIFSDEDSIT